MNRRDHIMRMYQQPPRGNKLSAWWLIAVLAFCTALFLAAANKTTAMEQWQNKRIVIACGPAGWSAKNDDQSEQSNKNDSGSCAHGNSLSALLNEPSRMKRKPGDPRCEWCI